MSENKQSKFETMMQKIFKIGTPECAIFCCVIALIMGILFLSIGFWKTLLIVALLVVALFIGGVSDKKGTFKKAADKVAPVKNKVYQMKDARISKAIKDAKEAEEKAEDAVEDAQEEIEETKEEIEEAVEEVKEEIAETVEEIKETVEEATEE